MKLYPITMVEIPNFFNFSRCSLVNFTPAGRRTLPLAVVTLLARTSPGLATLIDIVLAIFNLPFVARFDVEAAFRLYKFIVNTCGKIQVKWDKTVQLYLRLLLVRNTFMKLSYK